MVVSSKINNNRDSINHSLYHYDSKKKPNFQHFIVWFILFGQNYVFFVGALY
jgi:hypothetical protein